MLFAYLTASWRASDFDELPNEQFRIRAPLRTAYSMPSTDAEVLPRPRASMKRTAMIDVFQHTPATPNPLSPTAPMMPATWVPWPFSSKPDPRPSSRSTP